MEISDTMLASALIQVKNYDLLSIPDDSAIEHTFSINFERKMNDLILSLDKNEKSIPVFKNKIVKAAVLLLVICIGAFSLSMLNPQARADFKNAVIEFYENHIKFYFVTREESKTDFKTYENISATYTPHGFTLKEKYSEYEAIGYRYENEENLVYDIYVSLNDGLAVHVDQNNIEEVTVLGRHAYLIAGKQEEKPYSTLIIPGNTITITVYGQLDREEILKVGKSIQEK